MGAGAAHLAGLGLDDHVLQAAAREDATIGVVHRAIGHVQALRAVVEAVRVLHHELAGPQRSEPRPELVPELRADLVEVHGQLLVRVDLGGREEGEHLLGGRAQDIPSLVTVLDAEHGLAVIHGPAGLLPELQRLEAGHQDLLGSGAVHLLADDLDDLLERPPAERQIGIRAAGDLADQAGADHQLMAGDLGLRRDFLHRRYEHLAISHVPLAPLPQTQGCCGACHEQSKL